MDELVEGTRAVLNGERDVAENKVFAHPLPFNVIPHIDKFQENGYTKEEMKVTWETRKICGLADDFPVRCVFQSCFFGSLSFLSVVQHISINILNFSYKYFRHYVTEYKILL